MDYKKTMYLSAMLYSQADEAQKERLVELYQKSVKNTLSYQQLRKYMQLVHFFGSDGKQQNEECQDAMKKALGEMNHVESNLRILEACQRKVEHELEKTHELLSEPIFFDEDIIALEEDNIVLYSKFFKCMASAICYYIMSQFGVTAAKKIIYNPNASFTEMVKRVNLDYERELNATVQEPEPISWQIEKYTYAGANLIQYDGYRIRYDKSSRLNQGGKKETYHELSPYLYMADMSENILYVGSGNIMGVNVMEVLTMLNAAIVTSLPISILGVEPLNLKDLLKELTRLLGTELYCISPEDLTAALNRWCMCRTVAKRKNEKCCIFCGKRATTGSMCREHIQIRG